MNFFYCYTKKYIKPLIISIIGVIFGVIAEMYQTTIMSKIIDVGVNNFDLKYIIIYGLLMIGLSILAIFLGIANIYFSSEVTQGFAYELRKGVFDRIQAFSFRNIDNFSSSSLITRLTNDINNLQMTFMMILRMFLRSPITLVFTFVMIMLINSEMALMVLCAVPILGIIIFFIMKSAMPRFLNMQAMIDKINTSVQEDLINIRLIKSFRREDFEQEKFNKVADELMQKTIAAFNLAIIAMPVMILVLNLTLLITWWQGGKKFIFGYLEIGKLSAFISYVFNILISVMMLSFVFLLMIRSKASLKRVKEILSEQIDILNASALEKKGAKKIKVDLLEFNNVCFKYNNDAEEFILKDISFKAKRGETIAIIGATSSGKSSLVSLIPRFFNVNSGEILINKKNINGYDLDLLRSSIGFVMQKNILFSGSIEENIKWGDQNADLNKIINACKLAQAHDFIMALPDKYKTELGQMGVNISGGQKQRLCIARAIIKEPEILILDDSTSAVDTTTEKNIYKNFNAGLENSIKIIIAQRISSIRDADKIIVLDNGKIVGIGTHDELLAKNNIYKAICDSQNNL